MARITKHDYFREWQVQEILLYLPCLLGEVESNYFPMYDGCEWVCTVESQRKNANRHLVRLEVWEQERRTTLANSHSLKYGTVNKEEREFNC